ncbi:MAG: hypothetical protein QF506_01255 [Candidatus Woesearchaeota archaeon]|jgi:hypothetical protein|nr:hypothetical protein [Candidatus Woesearchaeota archaeon]|tara:strand:- start:1113 stop:1934 length:822 start_codon:yes stop_codon:yes gene_type:complete
MEEDRKDEEKHGTEHHHIKHEHHHRHDNEGKLITKSIVTLIVALVLILLFNEVQMNAISGMVTTGVSAGGVNQASNSETKTSSGSTSLSQNKDLSDINLEEIKSTAHTIAAVFPLEGLDGDGVMEVMFPIGTPEYGEELGVSFDDPVTALNVLAKMYKGLKAEVEKSNPEAFQRFVNLASNPYGISCEYCCGIGPAGADKKGNSKCGCAHNPGILSLSLYLSAYTDYSDGEILREAMRWKTLWFPKNMIGLGADLAGGDTSSLDNLPGMVGGC